MQSLNVTDFWDVRACHAVGTYWHLKGMMCLHHLSW